MLAEQECTTSQGSSYWMRSSTPNRDTGRSGKTAGAETLAHEDAGNSRPCVITCGTGILFSRSEGVTKNALLRMTIKLHHYRTFSSVGDHSWSCYNDHDY